jgi:hypothetical protein
MTSLVLVSVLALRATAGKATEVSFHEQNGWSEP